MNTVKKVRIFGKEYKEEELLYGLIKQFIDIFLNILKRFSLPVLTVSLLAFCFSFIVTHGSMNFKLWEPMNITFNNAWDHLLVGRYDVDPETIGGEAFFRNGKAYTYFGIFPSILRGFIELFFKRDGKDWARISVVLAALVIVISVYFAYVKVLENIRASDGAKLYYKILFAAACAFGMPHVILLSCAYIFHEAIIWGLAWSCVFVWALVNFIFSKDVNSKLLFVLSISTGFALLSRITYFMATSLVFIALMSVVIIVAFENLCHFKVLKTVLNFLNWSKAKMTKKEVLIAITSGVLPLFLCLLFQLNVNYGRWGNPFHFNPYHLYGMMHSNPYRFEMLNKTGLVNPGRLPFGILHYFVLSPKHHFSDKFPYLEISGHHELARFFKPMFYDNIEPTNPMIINSPILLLSFVVGLFALAKTYGPLGFILGILFLIPNVSMLCYSALSERYLPEFMPSFLFCAFAASSVFLSIEKKGKLFKTITRLSILLVTLFSIYGSNISMLKLKLNLWSVPHDVKETIISNFDKVNQITNMNFLYKNISREGVLQVVRIDGNTTFPQEPVGGQLWSPDFDETIFWFDGDNWLLIKDNNKKYLGPITMLIRFNPKPGTAEPIFVTGKTSFGDLLVVNYEPDNVIYFGFDHWGSAGTVSEKIKIDPQHFYLLEASIGSFYQNVNLGKLSTNVIVKLDGKTVIDHPIGFHPTTSSQIVIGENVIGGTSAAPRFTGEIKEVRITGSQFPELKEEKELEQAINSTT